MLPPKSRPPADTHTRRPRLARNAVGSAANKEGNSDDKMSFETRKQDADKALKKWRKSTRSDDARKRLTKDGEHLWDLASELAEALDNLLAHAWSRT